MHKILGGQEYVDGRPYKKGVGIPVGIRNGIYFKKLSVLSATELLKQEINKEIGYARNCGNQYAVKLLNELKKKLYEYFEDVYGEKTSLRK